MRSDLKVGAARILYTSVTVFCFYILWNIVAEPCRTSGAKVEEIHQRTIKIINENGWNLNLPPITL